MKKSTNNPDLGQISLIESGGNLGDKVESEFKKEHERLEFLVRANELLTTSLDYKITLQKVVELAVPEIADWCAVDMLSPEGKPELLAVAHINPKKIAWARRLRKTQPVDMSANTGLPAVLKTGRPEIYKEITDEMIVAASKNEKELALLREVGFKSLMIVPIKTTQKVLGAITFVSSTEGKYFQNADLLLAEGLSRKAALAIENSLLHEEVKIGRDNLEIIFQGVVDGISVQNNVGKVVYANDAAARMVGLSSGEEFVSTNTKEIISKFEVLDEQGKAFDLSQLPGRLALQGKHPVARIVRFRIKSSGEERVSSVKASPVFNESGKVIFAVTIFRDITESKKAEERLKDSEERFRSLVQSAPDIIFTVDRESKIQFINRVLPGYDIKTVVGTSAFEFLPKEYQPIMKKAFARVFKTGVAQTYEVEGYSGGGKISWYRSNVGPIRIGGKIVALTVVSTDITSQKQDQNELQSSHTELEQRVFERTVDLQKTNETLRREVEKRTQSERTLEEEKRKMEMIYNNTRDGLTLYDKDGKVVYINPSLKRLFGVKESILGIPREDIVKNREKYFAYEQEREDNSMETQRQVFSGKAVTNVMLKIKSTPVKYLEANYIPIIGKSKEVLGMIGSFRDVTTMKSQAERIAQNLVEVERQKNRWEAIFQNVEEGIYIMDKDMRVVSMNGACELMSGMSEGEASGRYAHEIFNCHDTNNHYYPDFSPVRKVYQSLEAIPYDEHIHVGSDGSERWVGVSYTPILNEDREILQVVGVIRDITSLKELDSAKSEFVSIASHELRTPLTIINGYLSLLLNGDLGDSADEHSRGTQLKVINKVYKETRRLTFLVEELLNVSRIEEGRLKLRLRKMHLSDLISEVVGEMQPLASSSLIDINLELDKETQSNLVMADRDKMKQVLVNLIDNAIKYNREHGKVDIKAQCNDGHVSISIEDNGVGIPSSLQSKIFAKFQQVPGSYIKENKGTGLGLFIVKSLVELHGGEVNVKSTPGLGSKFSFSLPTVALQN